MHFKLKFIALLFSYSFFVVVIIISANAVIPEEELPVLKQEDEIVRKVDNDFLRNKNSVYDILENNFSDQNKPNNISKIDENDLKKNNININNDKILRLQFASFKTKQKSILITEKLKGIFLKNTVDLSLTIKKVKINNDQIFFRVVSNEFFSLNEAKKVCKRLEEIKIECIMIKKS